MNESKPFSVVIQEARNDIVTAINKQQIHSSILRMILKEIYEEVCMLDEQIVKSEQEQYNKSQGKDEAKKDEYLE